jgi:hypothetical protein
MKMSQEQMKEQMTQKMRMSAVTDSVAAFQAALEGSYAAHGVQYTSILAQVVSDYARQLMMANGLLDMQEYAIS